MKVLSHANAQGPGGTRSLTAPDDVYSGDEVATDQVGQAQIRFVDNTHFVVGPNSRAVIDDFLFKPDGTATDVALNAVKGTFRFITGKSPKEVYSIKTPTMSIVVRGTIVDLHVLGSGESIASWQEGSGQACVTPVGEAGGGRTECRDVNAGDVVGSEPGGGFKTFKPGERRSDLAVISQGLGPGLAPEFRTGTTPGDPYLGKTPESSENSKREPPSPPQASGSSPGYG